MSLGHEAKLMAKLLERPEDTATYLALGDLLQQRGHPRGELIALQHALEGKSTVAARRQRMRRQEALFRAHTDELLGPLAALSDTLSKWPGEQRVMSLKWRLGFIESARLLGPFAQPEQCAAALEALLSHPSAALTRSLQIEPYRKYWTPLTLAQRDVLSVLVERPALGLRALHYGGYGRTVEQDRLGTPLELTDDVLSRHPNLRSLTLVGDATTLPKMLAPTLEEARFFTSKLRTRHLKLLEQRWPRLRVLELSLEGLALAPVALIRSLLPTNVPALRWLSLLNAPSLDQLVSHLVNSPLFSQLESLDLSGAELSRGAAQHLMAARSKSALIKSLRVDVGPGTGHLLGALSKAGYPLDSRCSARAPRQPEPYVPYFFEFTEIGRDNLEAAQTARRKGDLFEAEREFQIAIERASVLDDLETRAEAHAQLGAMLLEQARNSEALDHLEAALALTQAGAAVHPGPLLTKIGIAQARLGNAIVADRIFAESATQAEKQENWPDLRRALMEQAQVQLVSGNVPGAIESADKLLETAGESTSYLCEGLWLKGQFFRGMGRTKEARSVLWEAQKRVTEVSPEASAKVGATLAALDVDDERWSDAEEALEHAVAVCKRVENQAAMVGAIFHQGRLALLQGHHQNAIKHLERSLEETSNNHDVRAVILGELGLAQTRLGQHVEGILSLE